MPQSLVQHHQSPRSPHTVPALPVDHADNDCNAYTCNLKFAVLNDDLKFNSLAHSITAVNRSQVTTSEPAIASLILLAEDNEDNVTTISTYLTAHNYRVIVAANGEEAVSLAIAASPNIILMDIQMPTMDGLTATRLIRAHEQCATIPIIALTALAMPGDQERCLAAGVNHYMSKPISLKQLVKNIQQLLAE